ncbi:unnamed protein product [Effrenium voratum]|uniref:transketolase n=1 Tax=Effrenium voratum TaxID=2562239 RepID=A0AA36JKV9_9DINO|nr:unnamed protein product [Effrenium voratum]
MGTWTAHFIQRILDARRRNGAGNAKTLPSVTQTGANPGTRGESKETEHGEAMHRRELGTNPTPKTLQSVGRMAAMRNQSGQHYEAVLLAQEAFLGSRKAFGEQAPHTLDALSNLGSVWKAQGEHEEAEKCFRGAFKLRHDKLGPNHPDTLTSLNNLASALDSLGRAAEAGRLYQECLERRCNTLGSSHPDTLTSAGNMALYLRTHGQPAKARELFEQVLVGRRKIFGVRHMDTIISMNNCASVAMDNAEECRRKCDPREETRQQHKAEALLKEAVVAGSNYLGTRHPVTLRAMNNLAGLHKDRGQLDKAKLMYEKAVAGLRAAQGDKHLDTLTCINNLGGVLRSLGEVDDAEECYKEASIGIVEKLGDLHPTSLSTLYNWALTLDELGDSASALPLYLHELDHGPFTGECGSKGSRGRSKRFVFGFRFIQTKKANHRAGLSSHATHAMAEAKMLTIEDLIFGPSKERKSEEKTRKRDELVISCLRSLAMDAVQQANSGHPGTPMAMAPVAYSLWARVLNYDPECPHWMNRDRFVLSMGHASMLLYGLLHVAGVKEVTQDGLLTGKMAVALEDIKSFRQFGSKCPGHPEVGETGVEMTTGPLGQGVATSVGMAIASKWLASNFNKPDLPLFGFDVFALAGDGCMQEGVSGEAASLAGHLKLNNLCWIWDNNQITIEGNTAWAISEDIATRFVAYGWNVLRVGDANDVEALTRAFLSFRREQDRPTLIVVDSHIAWGAPTMQDSFHAHGTPLGEKEVAATKHIYNWPDEKFLVPEEVVGHFRQQMLERGGAKRQHWEQMLATYRVQYPQEGALLQAMLDGQLPQDWDRFCQAFPADAKGLATRQSSSACLNSVAKGLPWLIGGSADLASSCLTTLTKEADFLPPASRWGHFGGRNLHFGIREHAMGSIMNGLALCKLRPFGSTFLVFSDYMRPPIRMAALMEVPSVFVFTHDSIGVGEDGPTHQPVEQLCSLRSIPGLFVFRPCDANECLEMWKAVVPMKDPVAVVLSRQALPTLDREKFASASGLHRGGYVLADSEGMPNLILMATGSEVHLMLQAHEVLAGRGIKVRSVSMPCMELFKTQPQDYIDSVLPRACRARVSLEAGRSDSWGALIGLDGEHVGMISFGASGPGKRVQAGWQGRVRLHRRCGGHGCRTSDAWHPPRDVLTGAVPA